MSQEITDFTGMKVSCDSFHVSCCVACLTLLCTVTGLHLQGTWAPYQRYRFLTKFGVQRTKADELEASRGYVYGNITLFKENYF
ncbi:unnamed protein product, partial [Dicrocoelium dendriticum]